MAGMLTWMLTNTRRARDPGISVQRAEHVLGPHMPDPPATPGSPVPQIAFGPRRLPRAIVSLKTAGLRLLTSAAARHL
jgi:hypothetical protein